MNINKKIIFSDSILLLKEKNQNIFNLIINELNQSKLKNPGRFVSNVGGYQVEGSNQQITNYLLQLSATCLTKYYEFKNIQLLANGYWINENLKYNYNKLHIHPHSHFSGIFYIMVPSNSGTISFTRNDLTHQYLNLNQFSNNTDFNIVHEINPEEGLFIMFPANLSHQVNPNLSDDRRISVAFNLQIKNHG